MADVSMRHERRLDRVMTIVIALTFFFLISPSAIDGRYSLLELVLALLASVFVIAHLQPARALPAVPTAIVALLVVMGLSTLWSFASWDTVRDSVTYALIALAAWLVVKSSPLSTVVRGIALGGLLVLFASVAVWLVDPSSALYYADSGFQGIYANRNSLGFVMISALPAAMALHLPFKGGRWVQAAIVAAFVSAVVFTESKTSLVVVVLLLIAWIAIALSRRSLAYPAAIGGVAIIAAIVAFANSGPILAFLGKGDSLNGRLEVWAAVLRVFPESPVIGFGWSRSWPPGSPHSVAAADALGGHVVFHAHNEILNWLATTGLIGTFLLISVYGFVFWSGLQVFSRSDVVSAIWLPLTAVMIVGRGLSEISETNAQGWFVLMLGGFACARYLPEALGRPMSRLVVMPVNWARDRNDTNFRDRMGTS